MLAKLKRVSLLCTSQTTAVHDLHDPELTQQQEPQLPKQSSKKVQVQQAQQSQPQQQSLQPINSTHVPLQPHNKRVLQPSGISFVDIKRADEKKVSPHNNDVAQLMAYVPATVVKQYLQETQSLQGPKSESFEASLFYADVSNFSSLAERLSRLKDLDGGSDRLTELMNKYLGAVIDTIIKHGGDIIEFAGDSFLAMWRASPSKSASLREATLRALQCALDVQQSVGNYKINTGTQDIELRLRVQVGAGPVVGSHVGRHGQKDGGRGRWVYLLSGNEVDQTIIADHFNSPGNVVVTQAAWYLVQKFCNGEKLPDAPVYQISKIHQSIPIEKEPPVVNSVTLNTYIAEYVPNQIADQLKAQKGAWLAEVRTVTMMFIKFPAESVGPSDSRYTNLLQDNISDVIAVIAKFEGMLAHFSFDDKGIYAVVVFGIPSKEDDSIRAVYTAVQLVKNFNKRKRLIYIGISTGIAVAGSVGNANRSQYTLFGSVVNLAARLMQLAFTNTSLPPPPPLPSTGIHPHPLSVSTHSHAPGTPGDTTSMPSFPATPSTPHSAIPELSLANVLNPSRSYQRPTTPYLTADGVPVSGPFEKPKTPRTPQSEDGSFSDDKESSLDTVTANTILCDEETYQVARARFAFLQLDPVKLKGFTKELNVFAPEILMSWQQATNTKSLGTTADNMIGREKEFEVFEKCVDKMLNGEGGSSIMVEGDAGQGKSTFITSCANAAAARGFFVIMGSADAVETATPYFAYQEILRHLAGIKQGDSKDTARTKLERIVPEKHKSCLAFFNPICALGFKETTFSASIKGRARNGYLQHMVIGLLQQAARGRPTLLIVEDVHWLDPSSWALTTSSIFQVHPLLVLLGTRPPPTPLPTPYQTLIELKTIKIQLAAFTDTELGSLITKTLNLQDEPPTRLLDLVRTTSSGNPFFARELVLALQDGGILAVNDGKVTSSTEIATIPRSLNKVITNRVDRLDPTAKMILRVASVIGRNFHWTTLKENYPLKEELPTLDDELVILEEAGFIVVPELTDREACLLGESPFQFKHISMQQAIYNTMTAKQKQQLHLQIAQWYVDAYANDIAKVSPIIFHHFHSAEMHSEALQYSIKAAEHSMAASAMKEAFDFLQHALASPAASILSNTELAKLWEMKGDVCTNLSLAAESKAAYIKSLILHGLPDPIQEVQNETGYSLVTTFLSETTQPYQRGTPESDRMIYLAVLSNKYMHSVLSGSNTDFNLLCHASLLGNRLLAKSGWTEVVPGFISGVVILTKIFVPSETTKLEPKVLMALGNYMREVKDLPPMVSFVAARSMLTCSHYFIGAGKVNVGFDLSQKICAVASSVNDIYVVVITQMIDVSIFLMKGEYEQARDLTNVCIRNCNSIGEKLYYGMLAVMYDCYALLVMGRLQEAHDVCIHLNETVATAAPGAIEDRMTVTYSGVKSLYHVFKSEYDAAWKSVQQAIVDLHPEHRTTLYTYIFPYICAIETLIILSSQKQLPYHKEALAAANRMLTAFTNFSNVFFVAQPRSLIFTVNLRGDRMLLEAKEQMLKKAIELAKKYDGLQLEEALATFELAKCYPLNSPEFISNSKQAVSLLEKIGAVHYYMEATKYLKSLTHTDAVL